ncbi:MAG: hypothetical protein WCI41_02045 [bacterium]
MTKKQFFMCLFVAIGVICWIFFQHDSINFIVTRVAFLCFFVVITFFLPKKSRTSSKKKTQLEIINESSVEQLLEKRWECFYPWDLENTKIVLEKCSKPVDYVYLFSWAFHCESHSEFFEHRRLDEKILKNIYLDLVKSINSFLKDEVIDNTEKAETIKNIYNSLCTGWKDIEDSEEMVLIKKRLEVVWIKATSEIFETFKGIDSTTVESYEKLFYLCKENDPKIFEIAEIINELS